MPPAPFLVFFSKTSPGPRSGRAGATAAERPCPSGRAGLTSPAKDDGRDGAGGG